MTVAAGPVICRGRRSSDLLDLRGVAPRAVLDATRIEVRRVASGARLMPMRRVVAMALDAVGVHLLIRVRGMASQTVDVLARVPAEQLLVLVLVTACAIVAIDEEPMIVVAVRTSLVTRGQGRGHRLRRGLEVAVGAQGAKLGALAVRSVAGRAGSVNLGLGRNSSLLGNTDVAGAAVGNRKLTVRRLLVRIVAQAARPERAMHHLPRHGGRGHLVALFHLRTVVTARALGGLEGPLPSPPAPQSVGVAAGACHVPNRGLVHLHVLVTGTAAVRAVALDVGLVAMTVRARDIPHEDMRGVPPELLHDGALVVPTRMAVDTGSPVGGAVLDLLSLPREVLARPRPEAGIVTGRTGQVLVSRRADVLDVVRVTGNAELLTGGHVAAKGQPARAKRARHHREDDENHEPAEQSLPLGSSSFRLLLHDEKGRQ